MSVQPKKQENRPEKNGGTVLTTAIASSTDGCLICRLTGELDRFTEGKLRSDLSAVVGASRLVVDLSDILCFDANGLDVLMAALRRTRELGGKAAIACNASSLLRFLFDGGFERFATVNDTVDTAVASLEASGHPADPGWSL